VVPWRAMAGMGAAEGYAERSSWVRQGWPNNLHARLTLSGRRSVGGALEHHCCALMSGLQASGAVIRASQGLVASARQATLLQDSLLGDSPVLRNRRLAAAQTG
jgi:hypothetical protein